MVANAQLTADTAGVRPLVPLRRWSPLESVLGTASGRIGAALAGAVVVVVAVGSFRSNPPNAVAISQAYLPPSWAHPFGTDSFGRDELARVAAGGRTSLSAAFLVIGLAMAVALVIGIFSATAGGVIDAALMRLNDVVLSIPSLVLAMAVIGAFGAGFTKLILALSVSYVAQFTRMVRTFTLQARHRADLDASRLAGVGWWRSMLGHVVPGVTSQLLVISTLCLGDVIIGIAGLSFLGLGVQPPAAEWGSMLSESRDAFAVAPWLLLGPGLAILCSSLSVNLIADAVRERRQP